MAKELGKGLSNDKSIAGDKRMNFEDEKYRGMIFDGNSNMVHIDYMTMISDLFEKISELEARLNKIHDPRKWISIEDQLPIEGHTVELKLEGIDCTGFLIHHDSDFIKGDYYHTKEGIICEVTHWRELEKVKE